MESGNAAEVEDCRDWKFANLTRICQNHVAIMKSNNQKLMQLLGQSGDAWTGDKENLHPTGGIDSALAVQANQTDLLIEANHKLKLLLQGKHERTRTLHMTSEKEEAFYTAEEGSSSDDQSRGLPLNLPVKKTSKTIKKKKKSKSNTIQGAAGTPKRIGKARGRPNTADQPYVPVKPRRSKRLRAASSTSMEELEWTSSEDWTDDGGANEDMCKTENEDVKPKLE